MFNNDQIIWIIDVKNVLFIFLVMIIINKIIQILLKMFQIDL